jgi:hypothetical protein
MRRTRGDGPDGRFPGPGRAGGVHHVRRPGLQTCRPLSSAGKSCLHGWTARHGSAAGGGRTRRHRIPGARGGYLATISRGFPRRCSGESIPVCNAKPGTTTVSPQGPVQPVAVPGSEFAGPVARLPAPVRFLLPVFFFCFRPVLLYPGGRQGSRRNSKPARPAPVFSGRQLLRGSRDMRVRFSTV